MKSSEALNSKVARYTTPDGKFTLVVDAKLALLDAHFGTQRGKDWYDGETFRGLMRLRGMECRSASGFAEAFVGRKLTFDPLAGGAGP